jgi:hypothetical protein
MNLKSLKVILLPNIYQIIMQTKFNINNILIVSKYKKYISYIQINYRYNTNIIIYFTILLLI